MPKRPDIQAIAAAAKRKGYFVSDDFPGVAFTREDLIQLMDLLKKKGVPLGQPSPDLAPLFELDQMGATRIIRALRQGIPEAKFTKYYSAGRGELLDQVRKDLVAVAGGQSIVRFVNADIGQGKTHALYLLRELAFQNDFAVSTVTLSQNSCPLYDFMAVYREIMWGLRTAEEENQPALSNIFDRWITEIRSRGHARVRDIVENEMPANLRQIMAAYVDAINLIQPNEIKRLAILEYFSGAKTLQSQIKELGLPMRIDSSNALQILGELASTIRHIGYKGICILFDEAEAIHSFAHSDHREQAFANLQQIIAQSSQFSHCYFVYATTPSFFTSGASRLAVKQVGGKSKILELSDLSAEDRRAIGYRIASIFRVSTAWPIPKTVTKAIDLAASKAVQGRIGDFVRQAVAILDEAKARA